MRPAEHPMPAPDPAGAPAAVPRPGAASGVPAYLLLLAVLCVPVLVYFGTAASIVQLWERSETFAHGWVILPISFWLIWQRRDTLRQLPVRPYWPALLLLALCGAGWLVADFGDVQSARQYMFALMLPLTVLAVLGQRIARALLFPLAFILFAVPFGEVFVPPLINVTANFTVDALRATGIPVLREGNQFTIPTGNWSVVEACSGVRYLISSVTLGCLFAYLSFRSRTRQLVFILLSIGVPVLANGMRAYMIVMIGHLSGMKLAVGVDHLIYGWVFFGLVMFLLFWIASRWREDRDTGQPLPPVRDPAAADRSVLTAPVLAMLASVALVAGIWPAYAWHVDHRTDAARAPDLAALAPSWPTTMAFTDWRPSFMPPAGQMIGFYGQGADQAGLIVNYYRDQRRTGNKLISSVNHLVTGAEAWVQTGQAAHEETIGGQPLAVRETVLTRGSRHLLVWSWYWIDGVRTASDVRGKLLQVRERLRGGDDEGAAVLAFAPYDEHADAARATLRAFLGANLARIESTLAAPAAPQVTR
jgi:exosortase A